MDSFADGSGYASISYLNDIIGGVLGVATAAACLAAAIALIRWLLFQQEGRGSAQQLSTRWLHIAGALLALCVVHGAAGQVYEALKDNGMSQQIASEATSADKDGKWQATNIDDVVSGMKSTSTGTYTNSPVVKQTETDSASASGGSRSGSGSASGSKASGTKGSGSASGSKASASKGSGSSKNSSKGSSSAGSGKKPGGTASAGAAKVTDKDGTGYRCLSCMKVYKTAKAAKKCYGKDTGRLSKASAASEKSQVIKSIPHNAGKKTRYYCAYLPCSKDYKSRAAAERCYDSH